MAGRCLALCALGTLAACSTVFGLDPPGRAAIDAAEADADASAPPDAARDASSPPPALQPPAAVTSGSLSSPVALNLPAAIAAGELVLVVLNRDGGSQQTYTWPTGWTQLFSVPVGAAGGTYCGAVAYRVANGTEGTSIDVTSTATSNKATRAVAVRIANATASPVFATTTGNSVNPDPPLLTTTGTSPTLWIALSLATNTMLTAADAPTGYAATTGYGSTRLAYRQSVAGSEDPGPFTVDMATDWSAFTLAIE